MSQQTISSIPKPNVFKTREQWLENRGQSLGGSEMASILGLNPYQSPYDLWLLKTGREQRKEENIAMILGRFMEAGISDTFEYLSNHRVIKASAGDILYQHPDYDFLVASPDRRVFLNGSQKHEDRAIMEIKRTRIEIDPDELPFPYFIQPTYYAGMLGYSKIIVCWHQTGFNENVYWTEKEFNPEIYEIIIDEAVKFWNEYVVKDIPPPLSTASDINKMYPDSREGKMIIATDEVLDIYSKAIGLYREKSRITQEYSDTTEKIKVIMKDSEYLVTPQLETLFSFKTGKRGRTLRIKEL